MPVSRRLETEPPVRAAPANLKIAGLGIPIDMEANSLALEAELAVLVAVGEDPLETTSHIGPLQLDGIAGLVAVDLISATVHSHIGVPAHLAMETCLHIMTTDGTADGVVPFGSVAIEIQVNLVPGTPVSVNSGGPVVGSTLNGERNVLRTDFSLDGG